jgi:hypothetical protein
VLLRLCAVEGEAVITRDAVYKRLVGARVRLSIEALTWLRQIQHHSTLRGAKYDARVAEHCVREVRDELHEILLVLEQQRRDLETADIANAVARLRELGVEGLIGAAIGDNALGALAGHPRGCCCVECRNKVM